MTWNPRSIPAGHRKTRRTVGSVERKLSLKTWELQIRSSLSRRHPPLSTTQEMDHDTIEHIRIARHGESICKMW